MPKSLENANTIVGVAASNENFTTLVTAVKAAELVDTLNSEGPFTVFAPTNDAFSKLPAGTVESLLKPESKAVLTSILTYHVVAGNFDAASVIAAVTENGGKFTVNTVQGGEIIISLNDGKVMLTDEKGNSSTVVMADIEASNGIIHAIDAVVMPE
ncbi:fasciclin domain-containing protein [Maribacter arenosus]